MKKIGLSILAAVLAMSVNAQINTRRELNCTEEAVTFKTSFSSAGISADRCSVSSGYQLLLLSNADFTQRLKARQQMADQDYIDAIKNGFAKYLT